MRSFTVLLLSGCIVQQTPAHDAPEVPEAVGTVPVEQVLEPKPAVAPIPRRASGEADWARVSFLSVSTGCELVGGDRGQALLGLQLHTPGSLTNSERLLLVRARGWRGEHFELQMLAARSSPEGPVLAQALLDEGHFAAPARTRGGLFESGVGALPLPFARQALSEARLLGLIQPEAGSFGLRQTLVSGYLALDALSAEQRALVGAGDVSLSGPAACEADCDALSVCLMLEAEPMDPPLIESET